MTRQDLYALFRGFFGIERPSGTFPEDRSATISNLVVRILEQSEGLGANVTDFLRVARECGEAYPPMLEQKDLGWYPTLGHIDVFCDWALQIGLVNETTIEDMIEQVHEFCNAVEAQRQDEYLDQEAE